MYFDNRCEAGRRLAQHRGVTDIEQPIVLGLPRGGVPVAYEVARELDAPLDVFVAAKIGAPRHPELAIGAVAPDTLYLPEELIARLRVSQAYVRREASRLQHEIQRRGDRYRDAQSALAVRGRNVIVVDDGIATGATVLAAVTSLRRQGASLIIVATPVCARETVPVIQREADALVCLEAPAEFVAVGLWYRDFTPTTDAEVTRLLRLRRRERGVHSPSR